MTLSGSLDALGTLFTWSLTFDKLKQNLKTISFWHLSKLLRSKVFLIFDFLTLFLNEICQSKWCRSSKLLYNNTVSQEGAEFLSRQNYYLVYFESPNSFDIKSNLTRDFLTYFSKSFEFCFITHDFVLLFLTFISLAPIKF